MLEGKTGIVTGGSRGIGLAVAQAMLAEGASVVISGTDQARLRDAQQQLDTLAPGRVASIAADVRSTPDVARLVGTAVDRFGGLDILINNAAFGGLVNVASMDEATWQKVIDTNLTGVYRCCHAAIPHMKARGGGWIINISSLAGKNSFVGGAAYCASKAGLNAFSEALMQEVRYDNIRVSYVMPGSVATAFSSSDEQKGADWKIAPEDVGEVVVNLLRHDPRSLPSRVELRPSKPKK
jgi:3-oxoacyl-[acyl-carrier protein] reductase